MFDGFSLWNEEATIVNSVPTGRSQNGASLQDLSKAHKLYILESPDNKGDRSRVPPVEKVFLMVF